MPKVNLTFEDKKRNRSDVRNHKLSALIKHKMDVYNVKLEKIDGVLCVSQNGSYYRLRKPADRINLNDLAELINVLHISNEEICGILRG